jgi:hypothetical protein
MKENTNQSSGDSRPFKLSKEGFKIYDKTPEELKKIELMEKEVQVIRNKQREKDSKNTSTAELTRITEQRHNEFKAMWQNGRVVQFKNDKIAILMRAFRSQVQFIVAYDQVTREGFRLMSIDEGKDASAGGFTGGVTSYYYFQKMEYVR